TMWTKGEANSVRIPGENPQAVLSEEPDGVFLKLDLGGHAGEVTARVIHSDILGEAFQPRARFENPDGTGLWIDEDFFGRKRAGEQPLPGPFSDIEGGLEAIRVAE
ncbi:MAG: hypothetical protein PHP22_08840, partial [Oscillospiraceae bacterium]|nr:hypothetical protein [Oscillospiraceae bacterium]